MTILSKVIIPKTQCSYLKETSCYIRISVDDKQEAFITVKKGQSFKIEEWVLKGE